MSSRTHRPRSDAGGAEQADDSEAPRPVVVEVPDGSRWRPTPAVEVFVDAVIRHPDTDEPVRVIGWRDVTIWNPDGDGPYWQRGRVPARELTLAPDGMYARNVEVTVPADAVLTRLDRLYSGLPAVPAPSRSRSAGDPAAPSSAAPGEGGRRDRLEQLNATLSYQVLSLAGSQAWTDWLRTAARFHHYSFRNTIAIWAQNPDATRVAGYRAWQSMGRQVRKGEQGIAILAPVTRRTDPEGPDTPCPGEPRTGDASVARMVGVRVAYVFDISQTDGDPLPDLDVLRPALLTGQAPEHLWDGLARQVDEAGYRLTEEALPDHVNGRTEFSTRRVLIRSDLEDAQRVKTLAHELGHVMLHEPCDGIDVASTVECRGRQEVEAESVAFLVASAHGFDTGQYSFPYVAGWAQQDDDSVEATLRGTAGRALSTAHRILDRLDRDNPAPLPVAEDAAPAITPARLNGAAHQRRGAPGPGQAPDVGMNP